MSDSPSARRQPRPLDAESSILTLRRIEAAEAPVLLISRGVFAWSGWRLFDGRDFENDDLVTAQAGSLLARDPSITACPSLAPGETRSRAAVGGEWVVGWHPAEDQIRALVAKLDTRKPLQEEVAWTQLSILREAVVPWLLAAYDTARLGEGRTAALYHLIQFARTCPEVRSLAERALMDRSRLARRRACEVLAYGLDRDSIAALEAARQSADDETRRNIGCAINAIRTQNHNAMHPGAIWIVRPEDEPNQR